MSRPQKSHTQRKALAPASAIEAAIQSLRGERVILDADLAKIYGVETRRLNQTIKRNREKFPSDFLFQLSADEVEATMRSQFVIASPRVKRPMRSQFVIASKRNVRHLPFAFTEHGAIMAANILNSPPTVQMSVFVVRAFVKMRSTFTDTRELARKLAALEAELKARLDTHESAIVDVLQHVMALLDPPPPPAELPQREMGFHATLKTSQSQSD